MDNIEKSLVSYKFGSNPTLNISAGATSDSQSLQVFVDNMYKDTVRLKAFANQAVDAYNALVQGSVAHSAGLQSMVSSLSARSSTLVDTSLALVDMHSLSSVNETDTTADISTLFGQATLPILEETNLLTYTDIDSKIKSTGEVKIWTAQTSGNAPSINTYKEFPFTTDFIEGKTILSEELETTTGTRRVLWVRIELPYSSQYKSPTCLEIYPTPVFAVNVEAIHYQTGTGAGLDSWEELDLTYLPGYNQTLYSNTYVNKAGPIRVWLPGGVISSIRIKLAAADNIHIGLNKFRLLHQTFDNSAVLKITNPWSDPISTLSLRGKDPSNLSELTYVINTTSATVTLGKQNTNSTPVITGLYIEKET